MLCVCVFVVRVCMCVCVCVCVCAMKVCGGGHGGQYRPDQKELIRCPPFHDTKSPPSVLNIWHTVCTEMDTHLHLV